MGFGAELKDFAKGFRSGVELANQTRNSQTGWEKVRGPKESELGGGGPFDGGIGGEVGTKVPSVDPGTTSSVGSGEIEKYIRHSASQRGIDPDTAVRVAKSEGGVNDPVRQSEFVKNGKRER